MKYFKLNIEGLEGDHDDIIRRCPICENILSLSDFKSSNLSKNVNTTEDGIWNDKRVAIPCCRCLNILDRITEADQVQSFYNPEHNLYHLKLLYTSIFEDIEIITIVKKKIVKNLHKFGCIENGRSD